MLSWQQNIPPQGVPDFAQQWNMEARSPQPQPLVKTNVSGTYGNWKLLYSCPKGSFVGLQEVLLANKTGSDVDFALAFLDPDDAIPTGAPSGQEDAFILETVVAGKWVRLDLSTALQADWRIYGYSSATTGAVNVMITGVVVSYL